MSEDIILVTSGNEPDVKKTIGGQKNRNWGLITKHSVGISALTNCHAAYSAEAWENGGTGSKVIGKIFLYSLVFDN